MAKHLLALVLAFFLAYQEGSYAGTGPSYLHTQAEVKIRVFIQRKVEVRKFIRGPYVPFLHQFDTENFQDVEMDIAESYLAEMEELLMIASVSDMSDAQHSKQAKRDEQTPVCSVALPQTPALAHCQDFRQKGLQAGRKVYQLDHRPLLPMPLVNMTIQTLVPQLLKDQFSRGHTRLYARTVTTSGELMKKWIRSHPDEITEYRGYEKVFSFFKAALQSQEPLRSYVRFASEQELFKDVIHKWTDDGLFTDLRLAGPNPLVMRKVTGPKAINGINWNDLERNLNANFGWERAIQHAMRKKLPLRSAIRKGFLYALRYENFDNISATPDIMDRRTTRHMVRPLSPIALFAVRMPRRRNEKAKLHPVAIQLDYTPDSPVYIPQDGDMWLWAKLNLHVTDFLHSQIEHHLVKTHLLAEPFCVCLPRHLSERHPLHQTLKYHCRGVLMANTVGSPTLLSKGRFTDMLFPLGHLGTQEVVRRSYRQTTWDESNFRQEIKNRGLDNKKILPYYPYRDDGELLYTAINRMIQDYVNLYYGDDSDVQADGELQAYLNELSADGTGPDGGRAKIRKLPSSVSSKVALVDFLTRLLWVFTGKHAALDYPVADYGAFTPLMPTKLYRDDRVGKTEFSIFNFASGNVSAVQASVAMNIGALRYDKVFDYGDQLEDKLAGAIVKGHNEYLEGVVDTLINERNKQRLEGDHLTYPYFLSDWLPNGIQA